MTAGIHSLGIRKRVQSPLAASALAYAVARYHEGYAVHVIAAALHVRYGRITAGLIEAGVQLRGKYVRSHPPIPVIPAFQGIAPHRAVLWDAPVAAGRWR